MASDGIGLSDILSCSTQVEFHRMHQPRKRHADVASGGMSLACQGFPDFLQYFNAFAAMSECGKT